MTYESRCPVENLLVPTNLHSHSLSFIVCLHKVKSMHTLQALQVPLKLSIIIMVIGMAPTRPKYQHGNKLSGFIHQTSGNTPIIITFPL